MRADEAPTWAQGTLYTASSPIDVGDETWLYFTGGIDRHGWRGKDIPYSEWSKTVAEEGGWAQIGLAKWTKDRIMGYQSRLRDVIALSPLVPGGERQGRLALNVVTRGEGFVRARLVNAQGRDEIPGYGFEQCVPIAGDHLQVGVQWQDRGALPDVSDGRSILAEVELVDATLYAFDFVMPG